MSTMEQQNLSGEESMQIIQRMIQTAKQEQKDNGVGWIVWGWLLLVASLLSFANTYTKWFYQFFFWNLFSLIVLAGFLLSLAWNFFSGKKIKVKTYTNDLFQKLNTGFFVCLLLVIVAINRGVGPVSGFALLIGIYGFWILIYGTIFNFRPSIIGAWITFACSLGAMFVNEFQYTMLLHAAGVLAGYIIPGHMALHEFKKVKPRIGIN